MTYSSERHIGAHSLNSQRMACWTNRLSAAVYAGLLGLRSANIL